MKARGGSASPRPQGGEGWDESLLVWNATVARIPAPHPAGPAKKPARDAEAGQPEDHLRRTPRQTPV